MKVNIKLVTKDRIGCTYVEPVEVHAEDDDSVTLVVEAWPEQGFNAKLKWDTFEQFLSSGVMLSVSNIIPSKQLYEAIWNEARKSK